MSTSDDNPQRPIAQEPEPGAAPEPGPASEGAETKEPDSTVEEAAAKRTVLVTVSDCVCAALACATSVR
jgi:hypothetical protein